MWLLMAVEHPTVAAFIARLPRPEPNLAAFGITFSLALIIESPIIMLLAAGTALARDTQSYGRLLRFTHVMAAGLTAIHLVIGLTPLYPVIVGNLMGVPDEILDPSRRTFLIMTPWVAAIAYRRLWQGVLIRFDRTKVVPLTILARLLTGVAVLAIGFSTRGLQGADLGALALSVGVTAAAITAYVFVSPVLRNQLSQQSLNERPLTWGDLLQFYLPLALTPLIMMASRPLIVMALARAAEPRACLAVWPVIMGVLFLGRSIAFSYQEAVVALLDDRSSYETLRRFTQILALTLTAVFALVAITPIAGILYRHVSGLTAELVSFAVVPTMILSLVPGLEALIYWQHGLLLHSKQTRPITVAVTLNVVGLAVVMYVAARLMPTTPGTIIAALGITGAVAAQWGYLRAIRRRMDHRFLKIESLARRHPSVVDVGPRK
jgi:hypothetical protein